MNVFEGVETVLIWLQENNRFYIPVNGKTNGAESASLAKKLSAQDHIWPTSFNKVNNNQSQRPPLPMDIRRNLDLDRLKLLPGISVTKIQGPVPDRKYFPQNIQVQVSTKKDELITCNWKARNMYFF